ncbi:MAG: GDSL family lipase [Phycisphaerae bacterium]|nr:GDSL family lipase [Phycisphaerae bacterium]|tara:strand:- start:13214 stop:13999 length:786 start_codon:yes stop_codon:yes gene_type:complete
MFNTLVTISLVIQPNLTVATPIPRENDLWVQRTAQIQNVVDAQGHDANVIFIGDSITQGWEGSGATIWKDTFAPLKSINLGVSGDRTEHVLWRLENGHLRGMAPDVAILMIGTNNFGQHDSYSPQEVLRGVVSVVEKLKTKLPNTHVLLLDIFPRGEHFNAMRGAIAQVNQALQSAYIVDDQVTFFPIGQHFIESDGSISPSVMPDYLHLSERGYSRWANAILSLVESKIGLVKQVDLANDIHRQVKIDKETDQYLDPSNK